ncbi:MAG TPA: PIN domain-containing protein [Bryobacterales bacterium]|nr:PIN domain-containing protein [Bryobacterales bacterium]
MITDKALAFVDTNVLVYAFEKGSSPQKAIAQKLVSELLDEDRIRLSTQVLQELFVTLTKKVRRPCSPDEALACLDDLGAWPLFVVDFPAIREAAQLAQKAALSFWDALIVVAAARSGAFRLYTEDLSHGQTILDVEVVNPFREIQS